MSELSLIEFSGIQIEAAEKDGLPFANLRRLCESLGIAHQRQLEKLKAAHWACVTMMVTHDSTGRMQEMSFLSAESIPLWLATINESKVAANVRPLLRVMQLEAKDALYQHFGNNRQSIAVNNYALIDIRTDIVAMQQQLAELTAKQIKQTQQVNEQTRITNKILQELVPAIRRIDDRTKGKREDVSGVDKKRLVAIIGSRFHGTCPCCHRSEIVQDGKRVPDVSQVDHYHHRSMAAIEYVWMVCKTCNRKLRNRKPGGFWLAKGPAFQAFQEIVHEDAQLKLPFCDAIN